MVIAQWVRKIIILGVALIGTLNYQHTYKVNGVYHHINGATYYSLYNDNNACQGYINAKDVVVK